MTSKDAVRPLQLIPTAAWQERVASMQEIDTIITESSNATFVEHAKSFRAAYCLGFRLFEYCSPESEWREYMGSAGFVLKRGSNDEIVARLVLRMN